MSILFRNAEQKAAIFRDAIGKNAGKNPKFVHNTTCNKLFVLKTQGSSFFIPHFSMQRMIILYCQMKQAINARAESMGSVSQAPIYIRRESDKKTNGISFLPKLN